MKSKTNESKLLENSIQLKTKKIIEKTKTNCTCSNGKQTKTGVSHN